MVVTFGIIPGLEGPRVKETTSRKGPKTFQTRARCLNHTPASGREIRRASRDSRRRARNPAARAGREPKGSAWELVSGLRAPGSGPPAGHRAQLIQGKQKVEIQRARACARARTGRRPRDHSQFPIPPPRARQAAAAGTRAGA